MCIMKGHGEYQDGRKEATVEIVEWLRGRTGYGGGFTSADDVADAIERRFITERER